MTKIRLSTSEENAIRKKFIEDAQKGEIVN
jgi:hypothetical protein